MKEYWRHMIAKLKLFRFAPFFYETSSPSSPPPHALLALNCTPPLPFKTIGTDTGLI